jgi:signal transduction histidine kinase
LNNIAKHAEANRIEISLEQKDSMICASIMDNGKGFDLNRVLHPESPERGFGIIGMQERVSLLGGHIDIQSKPDSGTHIHIEVPYQKGRSSDEKDKSPIS